MEVLFPEKTSPRVKRILEVLFPEKNVNLKSSFQIILNFKLITIFNFKVKRKKFSSPIANRQTPNAATHAAFWKYCSRKKRPHLSRLSRASAHTGPILPFFIFIFPGIVLPFCYFSVVRKVTEKPVLFLPHPKKYLRKFNSNFAL